jgi:hypothetical protein
MEPCSLWSYGAFGIFRSLCERKQNSAALDLQACSGGTWFETRLSYIRLCLSFWMFPTVSPSERWTSFEINYLVRLYRIWVLTAVVMKSTVFWHITPCSPLKVIWCFGGTSRRAKLCLPPDFTFVSCATYFSTLKMEAICSSETSVWLSAYYTALYPRW